MKLFDKILKAGDGKRLKTIQSVVAPVNALEPEIKALSDSELQAKTAEFRQRLENGAPLDDIVVESFAVTREAAIRVFGQRHYDVQLMGGAALHFGWVAEMKTGEGKTLVSTLPAYLNGLAGGGVHQITVNEYLASRDAEWMGSLHKWLGLTVGLVVPGMQQGPNKKAQYDADVTYGTNNEFGFDYLRDNMARGPEGMVQRGQNYAIVDEIDSILIDEARTPLIISGKVKGAADLYDRFSQIAGRLRRDDDYEVDEEKRLVTVTEEGVNTVEAALGIENLYDGVQGDLVHHLNQALRAKELFKRDKDYLLADGEVKIVDEFTGRVLDGRRWSDGLHQAVESKEGVAIKDEQQTMATVTLQNYFRLYEKLSGMTGTAQSDAAELETTYGLPVVPIPTNKPIIRMDEADYIYKNELGKYDSIVADVEGRIKRGQPVLVGTASVEKSEKISELFNERRIEHEVLNAKQHTREADVVAQAGAPGAITVATNMAGRGVDIVLGGNAEKLAESDTRAEGLELGTEEGDEYYQKRMHYWEPITSEKRQQVIDAGGLYVLATERHESRRIDNQLRGRAGRQGEPGESRFYLSLDDDLMRIFASGALSGVMDRAMPDDQPIESKMVSKSVERAQTTVEQRNAETRKNVLKYDEVFNQQRKIIYSRRLQLMEKGGLRDDTMSAIETTATGLVATHCTENLDDTWDLSGLLTDTKQFWPTELTEDELSEARNLNDLGEILTAEATQIYEDRESQMGPDLMRQVENQIMLQLIDQRWREHLTEMDQLRQGIGLRAMGQRDPLTEFQREGFDMFSGMMAALENDFVRYVMHVQMVEKPAAPPEESKAPEDAPFPQAPSGTVGVGQSAPNPVAGIGQVAAKGLNAPVPTTTDMQANKADIDSAPSNPSKPGQPAEPERSNKPKINDEWANTGRNDLCPCSSGKKFKKCHGAN